jgi:hypothetical protein
LLNRPITRTNGASRAKYTPGCVFAVRCSDPASRVMTGCGAQKLRAKVASGASAAAVPGTMNESWLPGMAKIGAG